MPRTPAARKPWIGSWDLRFYNIKQPLEQVSYFRFFWDVWLVDSALEIVEIVGVSLEGAVQLAPFEIGKVRLKIHQDIAVPKVLKVVQILQLIIVFPGGSSGGIGTSSARTGAGLLQDSVRRMSRWESQNYLSLSNQIYRPYQTCPLPTLRPDQLWPR